VQGVHTRVIGKLCEASARSALELCFEFREEHARWAHQNILKLKRNSCQGVHIRVTEHSEEALQGVH
jgi:hypothetical protein